MLKINAFGKRVLITLIGFVLLLAFQNCSPMKSSVLATANENQKTTAAVTDDEVSTAPTLTEDETSVADSQDAEKEKDCKKHSGDKADKEIADYYVKKCEEQLAKQQADAAAGAVVTGDRGNLQLAISSLKEASNLRGNHSFVGKVQNSKIEVLKDSRGYTLVCGADVKEASNIRGSLIVVRGSVESLKDVRGRVRVIDGSIGKMEDVRGNLEVYLSK